MQKGNYSTAEAGSQLIIPIFVMHSGCPHRCIFCNQKITAGNYPREINREYFDNEVKSYLQWNRKKSARVEIAFYGGSFTGIDPLYQEMLLSWAQSYIQAGFVHAVRVSTRPDYINPAILALLDKYNVTTVEIGAQSFVDKVLHYAGRGHDAAATVAAIRLLQENNFQTGLHLMVGLPRDDEAGFFYSLEKTIELRPDTVRIHPVVVFRQTALAREWERGNYRPLELLRAVSLCAAAREKLSAAGIRVIRTGLHWTKEMEKDGAVLAGPLHPAFGSLVLAAIYYDKIKELLNQLSPATAELCFILNERDVSDFRGWRNSNITAIKKLCPQAVINVRTAPEQKRGVISVAADGGNFLTAAIAGIN